MYPEKPTKTCICLCILSAFLIIVGVLLIPTWPLIYSAILKSARSLRPGSPAYDMWITNPVPLSLKIFLYNWTNPGEFYNASTKPRVEQLGPYTFTETKDKSDVVWNANNTVTFKHLKTWHFDQENTNGSLYDRITSLHPVVLSAAYSARYWSYWVKKGLNIMFATTTSGPVTTHTSGEILFQGYQDNMLTVANSLPSFGLTPNYDKFGWFYLRNRSKDYEGVFNMDISGKSMGQLRRWNYAEHTPYFPGHCGNTTGSAGELFPTHLQTDSVIKFFSPDLCRYVELEFEKEVVVQGIIGYKFVANDKFLDNGTLVPENRCFCDGNCMPYGLLNISTCRYGSPAFVSLPHFYKADPYYLNLVDGLSPQEDLHNFYMVLEPNTGLPLEVAARLQVNLLVEQIPSIRYFDTIHTTYFPILWFEQRVILPSHIAIYLKILLNFNVIFISMGIIMVWSGLFVLTCVCYKMCSARILADAAVGNLGKEEVPLKCQKFDSS